MALPGTLVLDLDTGFCGELTDGLREAEALHLHDEVEHAAMLMAAEAVEAGILLVEFAAGCALAAVAMEGTTDPVAAGAADHLSVRRDDINDAEPPLDLLDGPV